MPVYDLVGGKCCEAADVYMHADGGEIQQTIDSARRYMEQGFRNVRIQVGVPGYSGYGSRRTANGVEPAKGLVVGPVFESGPYIRCALKLFEESRKQLGVRSGCFTTPMNG